jgi:hypothetical protein
MDDLDLENFGKKKEKSKKKPFVMDDMEATLPDVESKAPEGEIADEQEVGNKPKHDMDELISSVVKCRELNSIIILL